MARILQVVERNKATIGTRFGNYIIDLIVFYLLITIVFFVIGMTSSNADSIASGLDNVNPLMDRVITLISYAVYMIVVEIIFKGRSLGKLITGTKVIKTDGAQPSLYDFFIRNISRAVPFDQLSFFGNNGWHDSWSDTRVVKIKDYENAVNLESDIQNIGSKENS